MASAEAVISLESVRLPSLSGVREEETETRTGREYTTRER